MFKLVPSTLPDDLKAKLSPSAVDIQLVGDELASDVTFTWDRSIRKEPSRNVYTYTALHDVVPRETMDSIRSVVYAILSKLAGDLRFMCFVTGPAAKGDMRELENCIALDARHEELGMSGRAVVVEMDLDELELGMSHLGHCDGMRGAGLTARGMAALRADLRLFEPIPTTDRNVWFQPTRYDAIQTALKHSAFFFEEIGNGTRLRVVSTAMTQEELVGKVEALLDGWRAHGR